MAIIEGAVSGNLAEVDANNQMKVVLSTTPAQMGGLRNFSEVDAGSKTGAALLRSPESSQDFRLRAGTDTVWDDETFNYVAQNTSKHRRTDTTLTQAWASGYLATNAGSVTTTATGTQLATYRHFPVYGGATAYAEQYCAISAAMGANINLDFGFMLQNTAATSIPLDGVYFRWNSTGVFGVMNNNGTESTTSVFSGFSPAVGQFYKFLVIVGRGSVEFWIDDVLYGTIAKPTAAGESTYSSTLPWGIRHHHTGVAGATVQLRVAGYSVSIADYSVIRLLPSQQAGMGLSSVQGASGMTQGQTANYTNSAAPASATLSNTAAGYTTLGGQFQFAAVVGAETDYALFGYQNTVPTTSITGRNLVIRGIWIDTMNTGAAVATTATWLQWSIAAGSTAVSLATGEAAATRAPRRIALGNQVFPIAAAIGAQATRIDVNLDAPIVVEPGSFLHVILKMPLGTATASQVIRGVVGINAYWE
jgi:hypothetical protein